MTENVELGVRADIPTRNGRIYSREVLEHAINDFNRRAKRTRVFSGPVSNELHTRLADVSHEVEELKLQDDGSILATVKVLKTPNGKILSEMMSCKIAQFDIRGLGNVTDQQVTDLKIESIDFYDARPPAKSVLAKAK